LDVRLPGMSGMKLHARLLEEGVRTPVIVMTGFGDIPMAVEAMAKGAVTFLEKPVRPQQLLDRIHEALRRDAENREVGKEREALESRIATLTSREREVLDRLVDGMTVKEIAFSIGLSSKTVDFHRQKVLDKMDVRNQAELIRQVVSVRAVAGACGQAVSAQ
jgi:FixJ family two-component response regulator